MILKKIFSSWWRMHFLEKIMENVRKHKDFKLVTMEVRRNYLISERNYHETKSFLENLLAIEMKKSTNIDN